MTAILDTDRATHSQPLLPFDPAALDRCGIRMSRAEFARFLGVSKQAVSDWTRAGKLVLGADGLLDPRQAVAQLLRTTDPARLRAKVLAPLVRDIGALQKRVADLSARLTAAEGEAEFHREAGGELVAEWQALVGTLREEWHELRRLPASRALAALDAWVRIAEEEGVPGIGILDCDAPTEAAIAAIAPAVPWEGRGE